MAVTLSSPSPACRAARRGAPSRGPLGRLRAPPRATLWTVVLDPDCIGGICNASPSRLEVSGDLAAGLRGAGHAIAAICGVHPLKGTANQPRVMLAALASGATTLDGTPKETALHCHEENMLNCPEPSHAGDACAWFDVEEDKLFLTDFGADTLVEGKPLEPEMRVQISSGTKLSIAGAPYIARKSN